MNVLIPTLIKPPTDLEQGIMGKDANIITADAKEVSDISDETWASADALFVSDRFEYDEKIISKLKSCKVICRYGVGYDNIDLELCKKKGIVVSNVPDYGVDEVADHAMMFLLSITRGLYKYASEIQNKQWIRDGFVEMRLQNRVLGIIGLGRIGASVALRAKAFGLKVLCYDPYLPSGYEKTFGINRTYSLEELAQTSDIISLHCPLTEETHNMLDDSFFKQVKKGVFIINTARGKNIDLDALESAMKENIVAGAALDVLPIEREDHGSSLITAWESDEEWLKGRLIITPHVAFKSDCAFVDIRSKVAQEAARVLNGEKGRNCVNNFYEQNGCQ